MKFTSKICVPIRPNSMKQCFRLFKQIGRKADVVEVWVDGINDLDIAELIKNKPIPILIVNKSAAEQGTWQGSEQQRLTLLIEAAQNNADFIDIGIETSKKQIEKLITNKQKSQIIISFHDFKKTPPTKKLQNIIDKAISLGADIVKIATLAQTANDSARLLQLLTENHVQNRKMIVLGMGKEGQPTRVSGCYLGNFITFAALDEKHLTAPGQLTLAALKKMKNIV